jgi:hypothetical protein
MQQAALGSLSKQYFVVLGAMLSAYARGEPALCSFDAVTQTESLTSRNVVVHLATLCQPTATAMMDTVYRVLLDARATNSSNLESNSFKAGDWFDFL